MTVSVKPNGWFGEIYLAGIKPIRLFLAYPLLIRSIGHDWESLRVALQSS